MIHTGQVTKKKEKITYVCSSCNKKFTIVYDGWYPTKPCPKCGGIARMKDITGESKSGIYLKRFKDVTGFMRTKKGDIVGITDKGKFVEPSETRYNLRTDPFGWKATGIKK